MRIPHGDYGKSFEIVLHIGQAVEKKILNREIDHSKVRHDEFLTLWMNTCRCNVDTLPELGQ